MLAEGVLERSVFLFFRHPDCPRSSRSEQELRKITEPQSKSVSIDRIQSATVDTQEGAMQTASDAIAAEWKQRVTSNNCKAMLTDDSRAKIKGYGSESDFRATR
jgi:hypothetical protein